MKYIEASTFIRRNYIPNRFYAGKGKYWYKILTKFDNRIFKTRNILFPAEIVQITTHQHKKGHMKAIYHFI